ncbi:triple tyrosine motif-containing protein [Winogradskyella endarachnes]|uniref:LuxR family transcriptional regulator n=1 Tax=Winogradskyella endarachnes TaxID=2681965 RepID=A0A6L6UA30_9FLAO|nr:triple tyrosine motif-containing protein [Winogradskyella endarachnes]MUU77777.1 LuxR family transcriptional regulator [Winogradskyella endarachnes]
MGFIKYFLYTFFFVFTCFSQAQVFSPIQIFTTKDYQAEDQNWSISQSDNNFIYVANNKGLLEYNGASWSVYNSANRGILRSVKVYDNHIYTGGYMDFGFWKRGSKGLLIYLSLVEKFNLDIKEDEEFWQITKVGDFVLFQSLERIYVFNTNKNNFSIIDEGKRVNKIFNVNGTIYYQIIEDGVYEIVNGNPILKFSSDDIANNKLINIFETKSGLLLQTEESGFYSFNNNKVGKWKITSDKLLSTLSVYSSIKLKNGDFILGTISNGLIHLDKDGNYLMKINRNNGLSNNTVLSILEDNFGNIWLGLDNGINVVNINSPFKVYKDKLGSLGTVYASAKFNGFLYLGTNHGLFYKPIDSNEKFRFIPGTKGQVWDLSVLYGDLFCGHDKGTFVVKGEDVEVVSAELGTWSVKKISGFPNLLIQGNYRGLNILEKRSGKWHFRNKIEGFNISSRYFEFVNSQELLVSHEYKGVYNIRLDKDFNAVKDYEKTQINSGIKSGIFKYNNEVLYSVSEGVFVYSQPKKKFVRDSLLSATFSGENYVSGKLITEKNSNRLWGFSKNDIIYVEPGKLDNVPKINRIAISSEIRKTKSSFENILELDTNQYLIGTTEGYLIVNVNMIAQKPLNIYLNEVSNGSQPNDLSPLNLDSIHTFKNKINNFKFKYSVTNYNAFSSSKFQYKLTGIYDNWSPWSRTSEVIFKNLPHGDYIFEARAITDGLVSNNVITYQFTIERPWYLKTLAIIVYVLLAILIIYILYYFNKRHYKKIQDKLIEKKQRQLELEQLENQRQLIQFKNKNLQLDIENKNRELGMATMNLVKRNELLSNIKSELSKSKSLAEVNKVIKTINSSINDNSDWDLFEKAFNNVDKDFMQRIKSLHPTITPNDLRLCAYLRLNLSSKEIAPLLNISHKSVEVKRYRLRKKLGLDHKESLSNYIIEL